jgi:ATP-binding cassette subfamily F protein 3
MGLATFDAPNLIILDEPTNHLDIDSRAALIRALNDFPGAVILISHDRHLIEATVDRLWIVRDGTVRPFRWRSRGLPPGSRRDIRPRQEGGRQRRRLEGRAAQTGGAATRQPRPHQEKDQ